MSSNKKKILLLGEIEHAHSEWSSLGDIAEIIVPTACDRAEFIQESKSGAFDGVFGAYRTFLSEAITGRIDEELVSTLPKSLKFLCHNGAGYDQIDPEACTRHDIRVSNIQTAVDDATADVNIFLIIGALRNFNQGMVQLREGNWLEGVPMGHDPEGKTLGILGLGGIGRALKKRTDAFDMKVIYHNRTRLSPVLENGAEYVSFDDLLSRSDVISLNLPLNSATRHIISTKEFSKMKDGVVIVNTARGAVMDEDALVQALASGKVRSCGLDVFEDEPKVHPGLLSNPRVMLIPHMGTHCHETRTAMECWTIDNLRSAITTGKLKSPIPEQAGM
ncbi:D-isomer specific 2-hydroxyacid dehydrogenase [Tuber borchii]|uniref:D-isomer specific 2-hydroxyacid dehydrogenase n=1 Tax=Tuber borchii TaxID=42251 RepID=A0A2T6ZY00_TUBBO|nr:D-isomer specific 2-hydroxyacid dehydrogenase [Tuber borchii]